MGTVKTSIRNLARRCFGSLRQIYVQGRGRTCRRMEITTASALIVAPHPDDEVLGTGALIAAKRRAGGDVTIVFLTGGGSSHRNCCSADPREIVRNRRHLALSAAESMGVPQSCCVFLDLPDGAIPRSGAMGFYAAVDELAQICSSRRPGELFYPHPGEGWSDHLAAAEISAEACRRLAQPPATWTYMVWFPFSASPRDVLALRWNRGHRLPLGSDFVRKKHAISIYSNSLAPCGKPWISQLPSRLLRISAWHGELFFRE